jgi:hypothetical protein
MQIHEQYPDLTNPQFNYQELSVILFLLYTNKLNPEFYRGRMLPYGLTQQVTQLVLHQTYYYMFLAVHHVHSKATFRSAHFILWAKINIARFQRLAISSIAFATPNVERLLGHILGVYHHDIENDVYPKLTNPPEPLHDQVVLGRALCKVFIIEHKTCLRHALLLNQTLNSVTNVMTHVDHHYVLNRHNSGPAMQLLPDSRNMLLTRRLDDLPYLIPFWQFDNIYGRQAALSYVAALIATFTQITGDTIYWRYLPFREYNASQNPVDQLIDHSQRFYPVRHALLAFRHDRPVLLPPGPNAVPDPPMLHAPSPLPSVEMEDNTAEVRSYTETIVIDPLNPQQSPIAVGYFHEPDDEVLSQLSHESIPVYLNVDLPVPPDPEILVEDNLVTPPKRGRDT